MSDLYKTLLQQYLQLPTRLEAAIKGLSETELDLTRGDGWSIREYVHHTVEGALMWEMFLRAILGRGGTEIPIQWYFDLEQDEWARRWAYGKRSVEPTLSLYRGSTCALVELLRHIPPKVWENSGQVTWPGEGKESWLTIHDIVLMNIRHLDGHLADIQSIRETHKQP